MNEKSGCNHEYFHESTHYRRRPSGYNGSYSLTTYERLDLYYCHKCLEKKEVLREEKVHSDDPEPIWWKH